MNIWTLSQYLEDLVPGIIMVDHVLFLDRERAGLECLLRKIRSYSSTAEAAMWINMVPVDDFLNEIIEDFDLNDVLIKHLADVYKRSWIQSVHHAGFGCCQIDVEVLRDHDTGDLIFKMVQLN